MEQSLIALESFCLETFERSWEKLQLYGYFHDMDSVIVELKKKIQSVQDVHDAEIERLKEKLMLERNESESTMREYLEQSDEFARDKEKNETFYLEYALTQQTAHNDIMLDAFAIMAKIPASIASDTESLHLECSKAQIRNKVNAFHEDFRRFTEKLLSEDVADKDPQQAQTQDEAHRLAAQCSVIEDHCRKLMQSLDESLNVAEDIRESLRIPVQTLNEHVSAVDSSIRLLRRNLARGEVSDIEQWIEETSSIAKNLTRSIDSFPFVQRESTTEKLEKQMKQLFDLNTRKSDDLEDRFANVLLN
ncbi:hypothetical protein PENTCL1PPCAC_22303 [Pristionchus entomophagus]|uniref:Uncharacterized protein n=1 Tax=Pristionchus entomophagus TaxID=358040 RepID=A0AAV5U1S1_9BILA|nr:hypothetical protein PENTCL1PPCAC_22303 [Pristionchus entomophagus]